MTVCKTLPNEVEVDSASNLQSVQAIPMHIAIAHSQVNKKSHHDDSLSRLASSRRPRSLKTLPFFTQLFAFVASASAACLHDAADASMTRASQT